ncbi:MAG: DEAD/DEAH box helicase [Bifidobacteriaceae bacterium]|jgi:superfamily II DNA or RNA helicase|nr:DEAD/DEAH box helicase [Bifidobacteriaceae bacterium]
MSASALPLIDAADLREQVGSLTFARGQEYARSGHVVAQSIRFDLGDMRLSGQVRGRRPQPYDCQIWLDEDSAGTMALYGDGICSCPVGFDCKHLVALALAANRRAAVSGGASLTPPWERKLRGVVGAVAADRIPRKLEPVALQFRHTATPGGLSDRRGFDVRAARLGKRGGWVGHTELMGQGQIGWGAVSQEQERWLKALFELTLTHPRSSQWISLARLDSDYIWTLLSQAEALGIQLVGVGKKDTVRLVSLVELAVDAVRGASGLELRGRLRIDGADGSVLSPQAVGKMGATGWIAAVDQSGGQEIILGPGSGISRRAEDQLAVSLPLTIPAKDEDRFWTNYYPVLIRSFAVVSTDRSVELPKAGGPELVLRIIPGEGIRAKLEWSWRYGEGERAREFAAVPAPVGRLGFGLAFGQAGLIPEGSDWAMGRQSAQRPLAGVLADAVGPVSVPPPGSQPAPDSDVRDAAAETEILNDVEVVRGSTRTFAGPVVGPEETMAGMAVVRFAARGLPELRRLERVVVEGELPATRELLDEPEIKLTASSTDEGDWFDLTGKVVVGPAEVAFRELFEALAQGETHLLADDGSLIPLDRPVFDRLRRLIEEARGLADRRSRPSVGRYHASLWGDLEEIADEIRGAERWRAAMARLRQVAAGDQLPQREDLPEGLTASLRPYQQAGYDWLMFVWRHSLGAILADDMGLGKTLQALTMMARARQEARAALEGDAADGPPGATGSAARPEGHGAAGEAIPATERMDQPESLRAAAYAPFLVVAPSSVTPGWLEEAARFTPGLRVVAAVTTRARDGVPLAELRSGADVVVTSYAIFRLDNDEFQAHQWAGLILDEAQFAKNFASKANRHARALRAPFKLAVTGTPLENSLDELWAIYAIVAPGLLGSRQQFRAAYGKAITAGGEDRDEALARLRRRVKPLLMRRTKEVVAPELPERQEQVFHVKLDPRHRELYDTHLQRERQRLLGLLEDYDENRFVIFRSLTTLRRAALDISLVDPSAVGVPSSKLDVLADQLVQVVQAGHRALVFSQFTTYLAKVRERLEASGIAYSHLDGSTTSRAQVIDGFKQGTDPVFLISLKAGGFGLNLTEADYVFLLDPWWNPATESQAIDRTHRIGQTRPVIVTRLVAEHTIEDKVMALKAKKQALFDSVLDQDGDFGAAMSADDVRALIE